jgi:hypothetical protein
MRAPNFYCDPEIDHMLHRDVGLGPHIRILGTEFALHRAIIVLPKCQDVLHRNSSRSGNKM